MNIPNWMEIHEIHVPNHQPDINQIGFSIIIILNQPILGIPHDYGNPPWLKMVCFRIWIAFSFADRSRIQRPRCIVHKNPGPEIRCPDEMGIVDQLDLHMFAV